MESRTENSSELDPFEPFDRFLQSRLIDGDGHPDVAFSFISETISRSGDNPCLLNQERGELGRGISLRDFNPEIEGGLGPFHLKPHLVKSFDQDIPSSLVDVDDFRERRVKMVEGLDSCLLDRLKDAGVDIRLDSSQSLKRSLHGRRQTRSSSRSY